MPWEDASTKNLVYDHSCIRHSSYAFDLIFVSACPFEQCWNTYWEEMRKYWDQFYDIDDGAYWLSFSPKVLFKSTQGRNKMIINSVKIGLFVKLLNSKR